MCNRSFQRTSMTPQDFRLYGLFLTKVIPFFCYVHDFVDIAHGRLHINIYKPNDLYQWSCAVQAILDRLLEVAIKNYILHSGASCVLKTWSLEPFCNLIFSSKLVICEPRDARTSQFFPSCEAQQQIIMIYKYCNISWLLNGGFVNRQVSLQNLINAICDARTLETCKYFSHNMLAMTCSNTINNILHNFLYSNILIIDSNNQNNS